MKYGFGKTHGSVLQREFRKNNAYSYCTLLKPVSNAIDVYIIFVASMTDGATGRQVVNLVS